MSGERGTVRKVFDISPTAITSNGNYDGSGTPTTAFSSGVLTTPFIWLSSVSESVADNGRIGISIAVETLDFRIKITPSNTVNGYAHLRMLIVADNECDGSIPQYAELLGDANGGGGTVSQGLAMEWLQPAYFGRFHVIEDKNWYWFNSTGTANFTENVNQESVGFYHESHHDMKGHRIMWDTSDASAIANARKGHIFMTFIFDNTGTSAGGLPTVTTANPPSIQYTMRMRYRDA